MTQSRAVLATLLFTACAVFAQEAGRASLQGTVSDASAKAIGAADVTVRDADTGLVRTAKATADGAFRFSALPVGTYTLETTAQGFGTARAEKISLTVGETKTVNLVLQVATVNTQVTVIEQAQIVNEADVSNGTSLNEKAIEDLPMRGRNFAQFLQLTPNSMQEENRYGIVVNGQRSINSNISIDGVDFNDPAKRTNWFTATIDDMGKFGPSMWAPINMAIATGLAKGFCFECL